MEDLWHGPLLGFWLKRVEAFSLFSTIAYMDHTEFSAAVEQTARHFDMDLSRPLVMVSGGPDSVALLRVLGELGSLLVVLHVDHGLRGEESREDAEFVQELCTRLGIICEVRCLEIKGGNLQGEARQGRYRIAEE